MNERIFYLSISLHFIKERLLKYHLIEKFTFFKLKESINPCVLYNEVSELTQVCEYGLLYFYLALMLSNKSSIYNNANFYSGIIRNYVIQIHTFCNFFWKIYLIVLGLGMRGEGRFPPFQGLTIIYKYSEWALYSWW